MSTLEKYPCKEQEAIESLRMRMNNDLPSMFEDTVLLRKFLVARDFDVDKAEKMLRKCIAWRKAFQLDNLLKDFKPKEFFLKYITSTYIGLDKSGNRVEYIPNGKLDGRDIAKCSKINDYMKHCIWKIETSVVNMIEMKEKTGKSSMQCIFIFDLDKLTLGNATAKESADQCIRFLQIAQDNYPEFIKTAYIINAPYYYVCIFSILKAMMSKAMVQKFQVFGHSGWKEKLLEIIDADVLPAFLGGKRTDPDGNPLCTTFVTHGGRIPERYYLPNEERDFKNKSRVKQIEVPKKEKKEIDVDITDRGSVIQWEFLIKNKDIGFGLFKKISEHQLDEVLPIQRCDTIDGTEVGSYRCQSTGKYIIVFDNSYSWMRSKEIEYCITVIKSEL